MRTEEMNAEEQKNVSGGNDRLHNDTGYPEGPTDVNNARYGDSNTVGETGGDIPLNPQPAIDPMKR